MESKGEMVDGLTMQQQRVLNGVQYEALPESTIATARSFKRQFFQKNSYAADTSQAICDWNTGAEYINCRRSYLKLRVKTSAAANFGYGGVTNLIRRVVITSRSGTEVSRTEDYNKLAPKIVRYGCSREYVEQFGQLMGYTDVATELETDFDQLSAGKVFLIPLPILSGFFEGDGQSLLPAQLAAGLRVELTLESNQRALVAATGAPTYEIEEISFLLNTNSMVDSWQRKLNEESAREGLTYSFAEWHTTQSSLPSTGTQINIEVRKAVADALCAFVVTQSATSTDAVPVPGPATDGYTIDNMKSDEYQATSVEWRLGSLYPYQQPIKNGEEMYFQAQNMWDSDIMDCKRSNDVSLASFKDSTQPTTTTSAKDGDAVIAVSMERNDVRINGVLNIGGLPTNNSRSLSVDITLPPKQATRQHYLYMKHLRLCKTYLDNCSVAE
jgi:hypothetical protein